MGKLWNQPNKHIEGRDNPNWRGGKIKLICKVCGELFFVPICRKNRSKYCSKKCFYVRHPHLPTRDGRGYIWLFKPNHPYATPNGYIKEHRYVIEQKLGRFLTEQEVVHHKNGIKSDNLLGNLVLFSNHSEHMRYHHKLGHSGKRRTRCGQG